MKNSKSTKMMCYLCDTLYDPSNPDESRIHDHPEPQSGPPRDAWIASGLPYDVWKIATPEGREWDANTTELQLPDSDGLWWNEFDDEAPRIIKIMAGEPHLFDPDSNLWRKATDEGRWKKILKPNFSKQPESMDA